MGGLTEEDLKNSKRYGVRVSMTITVDAGGSWAENITLYELSQRAITDATKLIRNALDGAEIDRAVLTRTKVSCIYQEDD